MRHAFSRAARVQGRSIEDPHLVQGKIGEHDEAGKIFGTVARSSRLLICDARARDGWAAARLHMHAEDEFSAGSYGSAKRDAVRLLRGDFPVRIVAEGPDEPAVELLVGHIDRLVALGTLGHLPVGGHKTRGAGWGRWMADKWQKDDVTKARSWTPSVQEAVDVGATVSLAPGGQLRQARQERHDGRAEAAWILVNVGTLENADLTLGSAAVEARRMIGDKAGKLVAWWCEPTIDFTITTPPQIFGRKWTEGDTLRVDEVAFFMERGSWRAARTARGVRWVLVQEVSSQTVGAESVEVFMTPARLHGDTTRFSANLTERAHLIVREWCSGATPIGFTLNERGG
jgi:hypothetical protein